MSVKELRDVKPVPGFYAPKNMYLNFQISIIECDYGKKVHCAVTISVEYILLLVHHQGVTLFVKQRCKQTKLQRSTVGVVESYACFPRRFGLSNTSLH
jgi:hypothetical protein